MLRRVRTVLVIALLSCGGPPTDRKPLAQESIGTNTGVPPSTSTPVDSDASAPPTPSSTSATNDPTPQSPPDPPDPSAPPSKVADLCGPKGKKPDFSRLAAKGGCKEKRPARSAIHTDIRGTEQLFAATVANTPDRELALYRLAQGYAQLECSLAAACANAKERETPVLPDDITAADAKRKTEQNCATLKSEFPKAKRSCP